MAPIHLYKFSSVSHHTYESIALGKSWYSSPTKLNDPYDGQLPVETTVSGPEEAFGLIAKLTEQITGWVGGKMKRLPEQGNFQEIFDDFAGEYLSSQTIPGILSLTANPAHLLMWAHYADSHQGIALRYEFSEESVPNISPINYQDTLPTLHIRDYLALSDEVYLDRFLTKGSSWNYEQEWRGLSLENDSYYPQPGKLDAVIFGHRTPKSTVAAFKTILSSDVSVLRAYPSTSSFDVSISRDMG